MNHTSKYFDQKSPKKLPSNFVFDVDSATGGKEQICVPPDVIC